MNTFDILTLNSIKGIGPATINFIVNEYKNFNINSVLDILDLLAEAKLKNKRVHYPLKEEVFEAQERATNLIDNSYNHGITTLSILDADYPRRFFDLTDNPAIIYVKGNLESLNHKNNIAIIGTREASPYGLKAGERLSSILTEKGFAIVSGLALGCDSAAHIGCLNKNGISIAILANPLNTVYPKENKHLAEKILDLNGSLVSEYPIGLATRPEFFVARDRLQSGLSDLTIVIETDIKGGTMHTVGFTQKQNRGLYCLYSHPEELRKHNKFQGNKNLVETKKAIPIVDSTDIDKLINKYLGGLTSSVKDTIFNEKGQGELF